MKAIIKLWQREESLEFVKNINEDELKTYMDFIYVSNLEITLKGNFDISFTGISLWIEDSEEESNYFTIPMYLVKEFVFKENK